MGKIISQKKTNFESKSKLFSHYSQFFDQFVVDKFRRMHNADKSYRGHRAMMIEIETYVQKAVKYDKKADYYNLVDTLKKLAENDF
tara:strand:+ start:1766 stop:2023 length:258 start_codon:yes stop_codon:yes gene_type:complete